jgi:hypothetical protein
LLAALFFFCFFVLLALLFLEGNLLKLNRDRRDLNVF